MNNLPRKIFAYKTPNELFEEELKKLKSITADNGSEIAGLSEMFGDRIDIYQTADAYSPNSLRTEESV